MGAVWRTDVGLVRRCPQPNPLHLPENGNGPVRLAWVLPKLSDLPVNRGKGHLDGLTPWLQGPVNSDRAPSNISSDVEGKAVSRQFSTRGYRLIDEILD